MAGLNHQPCRALSAAIIRRILDHGPLATLDKVTQRMLAGDRQVVFITGEAGIGKTSFIEMAMEQLSRYRVETLCGFCTERFGTNEAFLR